MRPIFRLIQGQADPAIDRALAAALPTCSAASAGRVVDALLERRGRPAARALIDQFHRLPEPARKRVLAAAGGLGGPLRHAAAAARTPAAGNAVALIVEARLWSLAYLITDVLRRGDAERRAAAADALLAMARLCDPAERAGGRPGPAADEAGHVAGAVAEALRHYEMHEQGPTLHAALHLMHRHQPVFASVLEEAEHPAVAPLRRRIRSGDIPAANRRLVAALAYGGLASAAVKALTRFAAEGRLAEALTDVAGLRHPAAARALAEHGDAAALWPDPAQVPAWPAAAQRGLVVWARVLGGDTQAVAERLISLSTLDDGAACLAALRGITSLPGLEPENARAAIEPFAHSPHRAVARLATRHLVRASVGGPTRALASLCNSPHPDVAQMAERALAPIGFQRLWDGWPRLRPGQRVALGQALIKIDPRFHAVLADRLAGPSPATTTRALAMITELGQAAFFEDDLRRLARGQDHRLAATAVRALGQVATAESEGALVHALDHADARVRANAVESLTQLGQDHLIRHADRLGTLAREKANRPRANAICSLLRLTERPEAAAARQELDAMLHDPRPEHRRSALWVVESAALTDRAAQVAEMAVSDADQQVKDRARRTFDAMVAALTPQGLAAVTDQVGQASLAKIERRDEPARPQQGAA